MKIRARVENSRASHKVLLQTNDTARSVEIPPRAEGMGSSVNGGELLCAALATCYCNDLYREAARRGIAVTRVEVQVEAEFGAEGAPAANVTYAAEITADASAEVLRELMTYTDTVAEIQNTLRAGISVRLTHAQGKALE